MSEKDIFEEARDRLQLSLQSTTEDRNMAKEDLLFAEGEGHWDDEQVTTASAETPELTINLTDALVQRVENNMQEQRPRGKCHPVGDGANIDTAETINGIGRHVEYRSEASVAYDTAGKMAVRAGWGYCRLIAEYVAPDSFEKDLRILPIRNIFTVYDDPAAIMPTGRDRNWLIIAIRMARTEYRRLYPRAENGSWTDGGRDEWRLDWEDKEEIRLAEYFRIRERPEKLYRIKSQSGREYTRFVSEMPEEISLKTVGDEVIDERESSRRQVEWFRLNGTKVVDREILPGSNIPVFRCEGNAVDIDGKVRRRGMVDAMMDPQRMVNYGEVAKIKRLGLSPKAPWIAAEG
ncbi:MAG TPA: portal protein, partial [Stellaceae bacterium]|nr:portal protein [Stellaceae bacterium]